MKHAVIVAGAESSGNRLVTRLIIQLGFEGDGANDQRWDHCAPVDQPRIVWCRSVPYVPAGVVLWPELIKMTLDLRSIGYVVTGIVPTRDWFATMRSQVAVKHTTTVDESLEHLRVAHHHIAQWLKETNIPYYFLHYDSLVRRPHAVFQMLAHALAVEPGTVIENITDENTKWLGEP